MPASVIHINDVPSKQDRGGDMRVVLSPRTVDTQSGFMGTLELNPGEGYGKHYHPYSDEYLYIISGEVSLTDDERTLQLPAGSGVFIARNIPHRLQNSGDERASMIFFSTPLAPRPDMGHVLLED